MIFRDKTVIVTGASKGIGAATARLFAEAGANLVLIARDKKELERIADELRDKTQVVIFPMDVADDDAEHGDVGRQLEMDEAFAHGVSRA